jgi:hypothetical protein
MGFKFSLRQSGRNRNKDKKMIQTNWDDENKEIKSKTYNLYRGEMKRL